MIPSVIPTSCPSHGERQIFNRLKDEPATKDWIVLHSLDIANHLKQVSGEADFVIIVPSLGVLCLEVKACNKLQRKDGLWFYGQDPIGDPRGPFKQAAEAMHSLRQQVLRCNPALSRVPFWSAVAFPFIDFNAVSAEWHPWQVIDSTRFRRQPIASIVEGILRKARSFLSGQLTARWFREVDHSPDKQHVAAIARILRPDFEFAEKTSDRRARQQADILRYTEEQFEALDTMEENERVLFTGPAGTGKTVLALEAARRASAAGKETLLLCFNRLLGHWLSRQAAAQANRVTAGTFHQYLFSLADTPLPQEPGDSFWKLDLPDAVACKLLDGHGDSARFDLIIADEVQDLLTPSYLDVLDLVLKGGLAEGRWMMFGDFERQVLYGQDRNLAEELIRARLRSFARCSLRVNCRNTPRVATLSHLLGKLSPNYSRVLRPDDSIDPVISYYVTPSQQRKELARTLALLRGESFVNDDIVVLSPRVGSHCAAARLTDESWVGQVAPFEHAAPGQIRYTTIRSFKGLDSPVVIVTDIEHLSGDLFSSLFYVATTRALNRLFILIHETAKPDIIEALLGSVQN